MSENNSLNNAQRSKTKRKAQLFIPYNKDEEKEETANERGSKKDANEDEKNIYIGEKELIEEEEDNKEKQEMRRGIKKDEEEKNVKRDNGKEEEEGNKNRDTEEDNEGEGKEDDEDKEEVDEEDDGKREEVEEEENDERGEEREEESEKEEVEEEEEDDGEEVEEEEDGEEIEEEEDDEREEKEEESEKEEVDKEEDDDGEEIEEEEDDDDGEVEEEEEDDEEVEVEEDDDDGEVEEEEGDDEEEVEEEEDDDDGEKLEKEEEDEGDLLEEEVEEKKVSDEEGKEGDEEQDDDDEELEEEKTDGKGGEEEENYEGKKEEENKTEETNYNEDVNETNKTDFQIESYDITQIFNENHNITQTLIGLTEINEQDNEDLIENEEILRDSHEKEQTILQTSISNNFIIDTNFIETMIDFSPETSKFDQTNKILETKNILEIDKEKINRIIKNENEDIEITFEETDNYEEISMNLTLIDETINNSIDKTFDVRNDNEVDKSNSYSEQNSVIEINIKPGKSWKRSILMHHKKERDTSHFHRSRINFDETIQTFSFWNKSFSSNINNSSNDSFHTAFNTYETFNISEVEETEEDSTLKNTQIYIETDKTIIEENLNAKEKILNICKQNNIINFSKIYPSSTLKNCKKIGEGVFGEVFQLSKNIIKIMPTEGETLINGDKQKKFHEIYSEIIITKKMSDLQFGIENKVPSFPTMIKCSCVKGRYPQELINLWEEFDKKESSENDHPSIFDENQIFIIIEMNNAGRDSGCFTYRNPTQTYALILQVIFSLAIAERTMEFEHRDLHMSNILINLTKEDDLISFIMDNETYDLESKGIQVTLIDFTISRCLADDKIYYYDLNNDEELFEAHGDYQFDVYRMMRTECKKNWYNFHPKNNIFWIHYLIQKSLNCSNSSYKYSREHRQKFFELLKELDMNILMYNSCYELVKTLCSTNSKKFPIFKQSKLCHKRK